MSDEVHLKTAPSQFVVDELNESLPDIRQTDR